VLGLWQWQLQLARIFAAKYFFGYHGMGVFTAQNFL
jgi:hypothetical protein